MRRPSRRALIVAPLAGALLAMPALAGDRALLNVVGYSTDLRYFAFEEYGVQDGSGFAYSNVYIVDLPTDRWVIGTPVSDQASNETETLGALRQDNFNAVQPRLSDLGIDVPAQTLAVIGDGAVDTDGQRLDFGVPAYLGQGAVEGHFRLELKQFPAEAATDCAGMGAPDVVGFSLSAAANDAPARYAHRDDAVPRSRGCPVGYRIYGVYLPFQARNAEHAVAVISVYRRGFEGPDRRFLAIPLHSALKDTGS